MVSRRGSFFYRLDEDLGLAESSVLRQRVYEVEGQVMLRSYDSSNGAGDGLAAR